MELPENENLENINKIKFIAKKIENIKEERKLLENKIEKLEDERMELIMESIF